MTTLKNSLSGFLILVMIPVICFSQSNNEVLWYNSPAQYWNSQALHIGNGFMGASFFGGVSTEELALSEKSFWTGLPCDGNWEEAGINPLSKEALPQIQKLRVC